MYLSKRRLDAFKVGGAPSRSCDTIEPFLIGGSFKGSGSAYGADWKPSKPEDYRLIGKPDINYWPDDYPNGAPEFKAFGGILMKYGFNPEEDSRFKTISEFKECIIRGGEPVFVWNGVQYGVCFYNDGYCIAHANGEHERICDTPDDVLEYTMGNNRLRDVITHVTVISRNI